MNRIIAAITTIALFAAPSAALAQGAATDAYGGKGGAVLGVTQVEGGAGNPNGGAVLGVTDTEGGAETLNGTAGATAPGSGTQGVTAGSGPAAPVATPTATGDVASGSLPFTGLDLALIAAGGLMLVGLGFAMRRVSRPTVS